MAPTDGGRAPRRDWGTALATYREPRVAAMLFLGFSAGLPFALVAGTLVAWLKGAGVSIATVGMFAWVGILYAFKFVWAPLLDQLRLPLLGRLGQRRGWMLGAQLGVAAGLAMMALVDPAAETLRLAWLAVFVAFCSATQDIAIDAWRIEIATTEEQGAMAAAYQFGYRIALLAAGAGALAIGGLGNWPLAYQLMAALMGVGMLTVLLAPEPERRTDTLPVSPFNEPAQWAQQAVIEPFADFFARNGRYALLILIFVGIYRISDTVLGVMANAFYLDIGFDELQIAGYAKTIGVPAVLGGAALGGVAVARYGLVGPLIFGAVALAVTNLSFAGLAVAGANVPLFIVTVCADNVAQGFSGTVFIAYLSGLTNVSYTATQYALFTSLMVLPGKFLAGFSGLVVEQIGWVSFFVYAAVLGVPAIWLATRVDHWFAAEAR